MFIRNCHVICRLRFSPFPLFEITKLSGSRATNERKKDRVERRDSSVGGCIDAQLRARFLTEKRPHLAEEILPTLSLSRVLCVIPTFLFRLFTRARIYFTVSQGKFCAVFFLHIKELYNDTFTGLVYTCIIINTHSVSIVSRKKHKITHALIILIKSVLKHRLFKILF